MNSPLAVAGLRKSYAGVAAVAGLDFELRAGECFGLLGPNGAGKTTTLRCCLGLTTADAGDISLVGEPVPARAREARVRVGVVPQFDNLDPDFSAAENLLVFGRYFGLPDKLIGSRISQLLEFAGLAGKEGVNMAALSGGMKRRLTLARALINEPDLLLLDEPTTGLDPQARHLIWERLKQLQAQGKTVLLTTHFMDEAERLCNRLAIMDAGRIIAMDSPRQLIAAHIEPQVVEIYGEASGNTPAEWAESDGRHHAERCEVIGETVFCYVHEVKPLLAHLDAQTDLRYLHRPANLEDVFLKLTGRELRD